MATTLTGANQQTEWWDLRPFPNGVCFMLTGNFATAVSVHYSNDPDEDKGTNWRAGSDTYSSAIGPLKFPSGVADFVRFASSGSWSASTTCEPMFAHSASSAGQNVRPSPQEQS